jgi:hypothetical protein
LGDGFGEACGEMSVLLSCFAFFSNVNKSVAVPFCFVALVLAVGGRGEAIRWAGGEEINLSINDEILPKSPFS